MVTMGSLQTLAAFCTEVGNTDQTGIYEGRLGDVIFHHIDMRIVLQQGLCGRNHLIKAAR